MALLFLDPLGGHFPAKFLAALAEEAGMSHFRLTTCPDPHGPTPEVQDQHPQLQLGHRDKAWSEPCGFSHHFSLAQHPPWKS